MMHNFTRINNSRLGQYLHTVFPQLKISVFSLVLFIISVAQTFAQLTTADIIGTVSDSSGAVVPNANVTLKNLDTNEMRSTQSNGSGDYTFTLLQVGHYSITVKASGFQAWVTRDLAIEAGDRARADAHLQLGSESTFVEVTASTPLLQADSATVSSSVTAMAVPVEKQHYSNRAAAPIF